MDDEAQKAAEYKQFVADLRSCTRFLQKAA